MIENHEDLTIENLFPKMMFALTIFKYKYMEYLVKSIFVLWVVSILIQCVYCIMVGTFDCLLQYGPMIFFFLFVMLPMAALPAYHRWLPPMNQYRNRLLRNLNISSTKLKKKIIDEAYTFERFFMIDVLLHQTGLILYAITIIRKPSQFTSLALFLELYFPQILVPSICIYAIICCILMSLLCVAPYYAVILGALLRYQIYLLNEKILNSLGKNRRTCENSEKYIQESLIFIIKWHQELLAQHFTVQKLAVTGYLMFGVAVLCVAVFATLVTFSPLYGPQHVIMIIFMSVWKISYISFMAQKYENESEQMQLALYDSEWYTWNKKNRKIFTILFLNASKTLTIGYFSLQMNHNFLKQTIKLFYTLGNVANTMSSK